MSFGPARPLREARRQVGASLRTGAILRHRLSARSSAHLRALSLLATPHPTLARILLRPSADQHLTIVANTPMTLLQTIARSASAHHCRLFLVTRDGRTAGRAGAALNTATGDTLDIAGSATLASYSDEEADELLDRADAAGAHYVLIGLPDREALPLLARARAKNCPFSVVALADALDRLAA